MRNLAPQIVRQRYLIEAKFTTAVDETTIKEYYNDLTKALGLKMYQEPIIFSPAGLGKEDNQGYDAFVPLVDSGISVYVWSNAKFLSVLIYSCKNFDEGKAKEITMKHFKTEEIETSAF